MNVPITLANGNTVELNNITESGSGYIRFSDGTQICYGDALILAKKDCNYFYGTITYPKTFSGRVNLFAIHTDCTTEESMDSMLNNLTPSTWLWNAYTEVTMSSQTRGLIRYYSEVVGDGETDMSTSYLAIGRWKQPLYK